MSVGGIVVAVATQGDESHVTTAELACWKKRGPKLDLRNATAVRVKHGGHAIAVGDMVWWHGSRAMWSPRAFRGLPDSQLTCGLHYDVVLERTGYSHSAEILMVDPLLEGIAAERCAERCAAREGGE